MRKWIQSANVEVDEETGALLVKIAGLSGEGVPYTGATADVDLGEHSLTAAAVNVGDTDVAQALAGKEPALPAATSGGYLRDDGYGNRSWAESVGGVPYTGASDDVDLGEHSLTASVLYIGESDVAQALAGKEPALPTASSAGYYYDDGSGNRSWNDAIGPKGDPGEKGDPGDKGDKGDPGEPGTGAVPGIFNSQYDTVPNDFDVSGRTDVAMARLRLYPTDSSGTAFVYTYSYPFVGTASDLMYNFQPSTSSGYVLFEAYAAQALRLGCESSGAGHMDLYCGRGNVMLSLDSANGINMPGLRTSDPNVAGQLWNNNGVVSISAGGA